MFIKMQRRGEIDARYIRKAQIISWGNFEECKELFVRVFKDVDQTMDEFQYLPEYDKIVEWMTDTKGKGLLLMGDCGRGKSSILTAVIPVLLKLKNFGPVFPVASCQFEDPCRVTWKSSSVGDYSTKLDYLCHIRFPIIDEVGVEPMVNNYGVKSEGFNKVIDIAEQKLRPLFVSTNLTVAELKDRYGVRAVDRLIRLSKTVEFRGPSFRK